MDTIKNVEMLLKTYEEIIIIVSTLSLPVKGQDFQLKIFETLLN